MAFPNQTWRKLTFSDALLLTCSIGWKVEAVVVSLWCPGSSAVCEGLGGTGGILEHLPRTGKVSARRGGGIVLHYIMSSVFVEQ